MHLLAYGCQDPTFLSLTVFLPDLLRNAAFDPPRVLVSDVNCRGKIWVCRSYRYKLAQLQMSLFHNSQRQPNYQQHKGAM